MAVITTARRRAAGIAVLGAAPLALTVLAAAPASAHGSLSDPVSRVSACFAEGPEHPRSAACVAAVAAAAPRRCTTGTASTSPTRRASTGS